jgi:26S proteasome regulatory subunit N10
MPLEAVMVLVDNSESSRNGDYQPTRFEAQADAASVIFQSVTSSNPESSVGLMSLGGKVPEVLTTLTADRGKILDGLHRTKNKICGPCNLWTGLQVAFLGLKHRQNRSQRQRIIAFVCSPPVVQDDRKLQDLALKFKKNNVTVDFVVFGDIQDSDARETIETFISKVKGDKADGAQMVEIKPSSKLLSDQLLGTPILLGEAGAAGGSGAAGNNASMDEYGEFDFDPAMEPELALALRMSMEEEKARQEKAAREQEEAAKKASLDAVKEEDEPLLDKDGNPASGKKDDKDKDDSDKMDTS